MCLFHFREGNEPISVGIIFYGVIPATYVLIPSADEFVIIGEIPKRPTCFGRLRILCGGITFNLASVLFVVIFLQRGLVSSTFVAISLGLAFGNIIPLYKLDGWFVLEEVTSAVIPNLLFKQFILYLTGALSLFWTLYLVFKKEIPVIENI